MGRGLAVTALAVLVVAPVRAQETVTPRRRLVADLESLATWCAKKSLLRSRNRIYEALLRFRPDHEKARRWLRYEKRDGRWVRPRPYREPRDSGKAARAEFEARRAKIVARYIAQVWHVVEDGPAAGRSQALGDILAVDPDHEQARAAHGDVRQDGKWVLRESVTALERRSQLRLLASRALDAVKDPVKDRITPEEKQLGLRWTGALRGEWWRFVGTTDQAEMRDALRAADAALEFVTKALPDEARPLRLPRLQSIGYEMYYLLNRDEGMRFIDAHPLFTARDREFARHLAGAWVPQTYKTVSWYATGPGRIDSAARMGVGVVLSNRYGSHEQGWIEEGFGLYLTWHLVGTRLTTLVTQSTYARTEDFKKKLELWRKTRHPDTDWLDLARQLSAEKPPDLHLLVSKGLNQMTVEDLVHAHALAAYMIEGRQEEVSQFLAMSVGHAIDESLDNACGITLPDLEVRFARWLEETR